MKQMNNSSWFEKNPKKTVAVIVLVIYVIGDFILGWLLIPPVTSEPHPYYHHGIKTNKKQAAKWGNNEYLLTSNSLGFKDEKRREVGLISNRHRVLFIGDSFVEGMGYPYERTFVGLVDKKLNQTGVEILNAGVRSYSPKLYYLKIKYLLEVTGLRFDELIVFIDISDIQDEIVYESFVPSTNIDVLKTLDIFLKNNSVTYRHIGRRVIFYIKEKVTGVYTKTGEGVTGKPANIDIPVDDFYERYFEERPKWTTDQGIYSKWAGKGLDLAAENITMLLGLCSKHGIKVTIAVYPWAHQIENRELDSVQVNFWENFAKSHGVSFHNYFPYFINSVEPEDIISRYYIPGDDHWNELGHQLIARAFLEKSGFDDSIMNR